MGITTAGLSVIAANMAGSSLPTACAIGISGLTFASGNTVLGSEWDRNSYSSADLTTSEQITFVSDFSPIETSGLVLKNMV